MRPPAVHRFGPFELDTAACRLLRNDSPVDISPRLLDLLALLVARPGDLITKEDLIATLWPGVFVTDNSLTRAVSELRRALGDEPDQPGFIQTVARRGYRFAGVVSTAPRPSATTGPAASLDELLATHQAWTEGRLHLESLSATSLPTAIAAFEQLRMATPRDARVRVALSIAYLLQFESTRAKTDPEWSLLERGLAEAHEACRQDPSLGEAWAMLGFLLNASGKSVEACAAARRAVTLEPDNWRHQFRLAFVSWGEDRLRSVARTLALYPVLPNAHMLSAMVFVARGALDAAERALAEGLRSQAAQEGRPVVFPAVGLHWLRGLVLAAMGHRDEGLAECDLEIASERPGTVYGAEFAANACLARGCLLLTSDPGSAVTAFEAALARQPGQTRAHLGLGLALDRIGRFEDARRHREVAAATVDGLIAAGRPAKALLVRASALAIEGRHDEAAAVLEHLLTTEPPGPAGWSLPVEPFVAVAVGRPAFTRVRAMLAERAV